MQQANPPPRMCHVAAARQCMLSLVTQPSRLAPTVSSQRVPERHAKALWGLAAARCSFTGCRKQLVAPSASAKDRLLLIGEQAHIVARSDSPTAPRSDPSYPREARNSHENLILLCPNHHRIIDQDRDKYDANCLRAMKREHEQWVVRSLHIAVADLQFKELEQVAEQLLSVAMPPDRELTITPPREKIQKNKLSPRISNLITSGLANSDLVESYIHSIARSDPKFPERLKAGFVNEYHRIRRSMSLGDELFLALLEFANSGDSRFERQAAGLTILAYFFEKCEVLER